MLQTGVIVETKIKTCDIKRELPEWAKVVKTINGIRIYNMNIFENIMSWNQHHLEVPAFDYYGYQITYGELPERVNEYVCGLRTLGITSKDVVTLCLPVSIENMLTLLALDCMGTISNNVNYLFLKSNLALYTKAKGSDTLMILDAYLPSVIDQLEEAGIKRVIVMSLFDYLPQEALPGVMEAIKNLPEKLKKIFDNPQEHQECADKVTRMTSVKFFRLKAVLEAGEKKPLERGPVDIERDVSYSYTSGTTGAPKCIVYKEASANAFIEMHEGLDTKDYVGERVFQVIPLTHATGERVSGYLQMAKGKTLVPQPIYNKDSFGMDLMNSKCNWVVAAPSFYLAGVAQGLIAPDAFCHITRPSSGGEPVTKSNVQLIDRWLADNGCKVRFAIGGGAAEDGSGTIFTYFMNEETKTNETGYPLEPYIKAKIVDANGVVVKKGERGFLHISSPAAADRYLNDASASDARWYTDAEGIRWGVTGDIAVQNEDDSYNVLGRASDSYVDGNGQTVYLFDVEYSLETTDPVIEWEISAHETEDGVAVVGQVVLKKEYQDKKAEVVEFLCKKYALDAVKIYDKFDISDVTGKRDYQKLKADKCGYYAPCDGESLWLADYANKQSVMQKVSRDCI